MLTFEEPFSVRGHGQGSRLLQCVVLSVKDKLFGTQTSHDEIPIPASVGTLMRLQLSGIWVLHCSVSGLKDESQFTEKNILQKFVITRKQLGGLQGPRKSMQWGWSCEKGSFSGRLASSGENTSAGRWGHQQPPFYFPLLLCVSFYLSSL